MQRHEMARARKRSRAAWDAIEERVALARRLLSDEDRDEDRDKAALLLDGLLWRMAQLMSGEQAAPGDAGPHVFDDVFDDIEPQMLMRLRLAMRAPDMEARLAQVCALLAYVEQNESMAEWEWSAPPGAGLCMRIAPWKGNR
jgi:hypothetical protein